MVSNIFYFHPYLGKIPNLTNIFQMGWNHQPGNHHLYIYLKAFHVSFWYPGGRSGYLDGSGLGLGDFFFEWPYMGSMGRVRYILPTSTFQGVLFGSKGWCKGTPYHPWPAPFGRSRYMKWLIPMGKCRFLNIPVPWDPMGFLNYTNFPWNENMFDEQSNPKRKGSSSNLL